VKIKKFKLHARIHWRNLKSFPKIESLNLPTTKPKRKAHIFSPFGRKEKEKSKPAKSSQRKKYTSNLGLGRWLFKFSKNRSYPIFGLLGYDEMPSMNLSTTRGKG
jgi:hypothetical protein